MVYFVQWYTRPHGKTHKHYERHGGPKDTAQRTTRVCTHWQRRTTASRPRRCAQQPTKAPATSRAPPKKKLAAHSQKTTRSLRKAGDQGAGSKSRTAEATSSSCCLRYGLGLCRAKTVRPLRTAAGQGASSKPRTAKATSSSCCSRCGRRPVPSQKTVRPLRTAAGQGTVSRTRTTEATSSSSCTSR